MPRRALAALLAVACIVPSFAADGAADKEKAAVTQPEKTTAKKNDITKEKGGNKDKERPACMRCGATCGLVPTCVCESGTRKQPKIEFDVTCEPNCLAGCSTTPSFLPRGRDGAACANCCAEPCACPSRVRWCKKVERKTVDEEVPTVVRKVKYICRCCAGTCPTGCCTADRQRAWTPAWWTNLTWWWPRKPTVR